MQAELQVRACLYTSVSGGGLLRHTLTRGDQISAPAAHLHRAAVALAQVRAVGSNRAGTFVSLAAVQTVTLEVASCCCRRLAGGGAREEARKEKKKEKKTSFESSLVRVSDAA